VRVSVPARAFASLRVYVHALRVYVHALCVYVHALCVYVHALCVYVHALRVYVHALRVRAYACGEMADVARVLGVEQVGVRMEATVACRELLVHSGAHRLDRVEVRKDATHQLGALRRTRHSGRERGRQ
jgi:ABC-type uncharacterized transport system permease subunit